MHMKQRIPRILKMTFTLEGLNSILHKTVRFRLGWNYDAVTVGCQGLALNQSGHIPRPEAMLIQ
jgi:hypothetical protein